MLKYRNKKQTVDGITFDSKREAEFYLNLKLLQETGEVTGIRFHPKYILQPGFWKCNSCGVIWGEDELKRGICTFCGGIMPKTPAITYSADFEVDYKDGSTEIIDVKGVETVAFKIKQKLFEYKFPKRTIKTISGSRSSWNWIKR